MINSSLFQSLSDGALLLTANRRLARVFTAAFNQLKKEGGETAWTSARIMPIDAWWQAMHAELSAKGLLHSCLLSDVQEQALWVRSIQESDDGAALLSVAATARELMKSWRIQHAWQGDDAIWSQYLSDDQRAYQRWSARYRDYCEQSGFIDTARLSEHVLEALQRSLRSGESTLAGHDLSQELLLSGFTRMTPQLQRALQGLAELGVTILPPCQPEPLAAQTSCVACVDAGHELHSAAVWARDYILQSTADHAGGSCAVVIADLHTRRAEVERVFDAVFFPAATPLQIRQQGRPYDLSLGQPLSHFAPVRDALKILQLAFDSLSGIAISEFLLSPYLQHAHSEKEQRSLLDARLRNKGYRRLRLHQLLDLDAPPQLLKLLRAVQKALSLAPALPSVWLGRVNRILAAAGWPGESAPQSIEFQAIEAWRDCVSELVHLDPLLSRVDAGQLFALLRQVSDSRVFQPQSAAAPIQIMGTLEAVGLVFDALWLTGFDNESWPQLQRPSAFLPLQWQRAVAAPGASLEHELALSRAQLAAFQCAAGEVVFSYPQQRNGNEVQLTEQLAELPQKSLTAPPAAAPDSAAQQVFASIDYESLDDTRGPAVDAQTPVRGGARLFEDQARCPFRAFALHRLQIRPLEDALLGIDARDKGNFFHDAMEIFWHQTASQQNLLALDSQELTERIQACIEQSIRDNSTAAERQLKSSLFAIEQQRLQHIIEQWIHHFEAKRAPFVVEKMEQDEQLEFESLSLRLKLDRVDRLTSGGRVIIDYKTGKNNSISSWTDERITSAQLPLYAILMDDIRAVCFAQVAVNEQKFLGMGSERGLLAGLKGPCNDDDSWPRRLQSWHDSLAAIAQEIRTGYAAVTPVAKACDYCELPALCRIDSAAVHSAQDEPGPGAAYSAGAEPGAGNE